MNNDNIRDFINHCTIYCHNKRCIHNLEAYLNKTYDFRGCPKNYGINNPKELCSIIDFDGMVNICKLCWQEALDLNND